MIKDSEWCGDMGSDGAVCFHTLKEEHRDVEKMTWDDERFGMLCTTSETFADWKAVIEKLCAYSKNCDFETRQKLDKFLDRASTFSH